jgi:hypothetical protein
MQAINLIYALGAPAASPSPSVAPSPARRWAWREADPMDSAWIGWRTCAALAVVTAPQASCGLTQDASKPRHQPVQQPFDRVLRSRDEVLVIHLDQSFAERAAPVRHQCLVGPAVGGKLLKVVGERVCVAEQGLVDRVAQVQRIAPDVQQGGVRQRSGDETSVQEVYRQLVGEAGRGAIAKRVHRCEIALADGRRMEGGAAVDEFGLARRHPARRGSERADQRLPEEGQFAERLYIAVPSKHALQQGGAGSRHAEDEDRTAAMRCRIGGGSAPACVMHGGDSLHCLDIVVDVVAHVAAAQGGTLRDLRESAVMIA